MTEDIRARAAALQAAAQAAQTASTPTDWDEDSPYNAAQWIAEQAETAAYAAQQWPDGPAVYHLQAAVEIAVMPADDWPALTAELKRIHDELITAYGLRP